MEVLVKKRSEGALKNRCSFPCTDKMKEDLDSLKLEPYNIDINEMLRQFAAQIIEKTKKEAA